MCYIFTTSRIVTSHKSRDNFVEKRERVCVVYMSIALCLFHVKGYTHSYILLVVLYLPR
jgi:hypothetical protein